MDSEESAEASLLCELNADFKSSKVALLQRFLADQEDLNKRFAECALEDNDSEEIKPERRPLKLNIPADDDEEQDLELKSITDEDRLSLTSAVHSSSSDPSEEHSPVPSEDQKLRGGSTRLVRGHTFVITERNGNYPDHSRGIDASRTEKAKNPCLFRSMDNKRSSCKVALEPFGHETSGFRRAHSAPQGMELLHPSCAGTHSLLSPSSDKVKAWRLRNDPTSFDVSNDRVGVIQHAHRKHEKLCILRKSDPTPPSIPKIKTDVPPKIAHRTHFYGHLRASDVPCRKAELPQKASSSIRSLHSAGTAHAKMPGFGKSGRSGGHIKLPPLQNK